MDVFEFTEALRRQRRFLIVGGILLVIGILSLTFRMSPDGLVARIPPAYEATVRFVVAPAELDSLSAAPSVGGSALEDTASFFQTLLVAPDAVLGIEEATGTDLGDFEVTVDGMVLTARAVASTREGAVAASLGAYEWLTERLDEPLDVFDLTTSEPTSPTDERGNPITPLRFDVSPAFDTEGIGLWIDVLLDDELVKTFSLADAAIEGGFTQTLALPPGGKLSLRLEDAAQTEIDATRVAIPAFEGSDELNRALVVRIDRGAIVGLPVLGEGETTRDVSGARFVPERIEASWQQSDVLATATQVPPSIGLVLLTEDPIPLEIGGRRGPIIALGGLFGGAFALIATAIIIDSWSEARRSRASLRARERLAVMRPNSAGDYRSAGPLSELVNTAVPRGRASLRATDDSSPRVETKSS